MRLGWAVANEEILPRLGLLKLAADTQSSTLNMAATSAYLARYDLEAHIAEALPVYRHKRDLMSQTMAASFPSSVSFTRADGGLFTWLTFPAGFDAAEFMRQDLLPRREWHSCQVRPSSQSSRSPTTPGSASPACLTNSWSAVQPPSASCCMPGCELTTGGITRMASC